MRQTPPNPTHFGPECLGGNFCKDTFLVHGIHDDGAHREQRQIIALTVLKNIADVIATHCAAMKSDISHHRGLAPPESPTTDETTVLCCGRVQRIN